MSDIKHNVAKWQPIEDGWYDREWNLVVRHSREQPPYGHIFIMHLWTHGDNQYVTEYLRGEMTTTFVVGENVRICKMVSE